MLPILHRSWSTPAFEEPFVRLRNEVDTFFDRFFGGGGGYITRSWSGVPIAMWDDDDHVFVEAELPGVSESDIDVTVHNGMLFLRGETKPCEGRHYLYNNRSFGRFERVIALPSSVNTDNVKAKLANGLLHVELSKTPEAKPKKITLQAS
jgi:HSP20 family protein